MKAHFSFLLLGVSLGLLLSSASSFAAGKPEVRDMKLTVTGPGQVRVDAIVLANAATTTVRVDYGSTGSASAAVTPSTIPQNSGLPVTATISGLNPAFNFHFQVRATNSQGVKLGPVVTPQSL